MKLCHRCLDENVHRCDMFVSKDNVLLKTYGKINEKRAIVGVTVVMDKIEMKAYKSNILTDIISF